MKYSDRMDPGLNPSLQLETFSGRIRNQHRISGSKAVVISIWNADHPDAPTVEA